MKKIIFALIASACVLASCDLLNENPKSKISPDDYFKTEADLQLFTNPLYDLLNASPYDDQSDHLVQQSLPAELRDGILPSNVSGWSWGTLRRINALLANSVNCEDVKARNYYNGVAKFFRAYFYFEKVKRFGDVPWIDHELDSNSEELYNPRDSRETVMGHMLEDIDEAISVLTESVSTYRVSKWSALALKAEFCLFEGSWRKYHGEIADGRTAEDYYRLAAESAKAIMDSGLYSLAPDYLTLFAEETADAGEYILAIKRDIALALTNNTTAYATMPTQGRPGLTKKFVDSFLMKDGTRFTDKEGWATMEFKDELADRDPRLACCTRVPGYKRIGGTEVLAPEFDCSITGFQIVKFVMDETMYSVNRVDMSYNDTPVYRLGEVYLIYAEALAELGTLTQADLDCSVNLLRDRVGMPHMDMAAANGNPDPYLLSNEYGYTNLAKVGGANLGVILEIRRERSIELFQEGFRMSDLRRWKEGQCVAQPMYGPYFPGVGKYDLTGDGSVNLVIYTGADPKDKAPVADWELVAKSSYSGTQICLSDGTSGYVDHILDNHVFNEERDYLFPIPTDDRSLNPKLTQNPGWDDGLGF